MLDGRTRTHGPTLSQVNGCSLIRSATHDIILRANNRDPRGLPGPGRLRDSLDLEKPLGVQPGTAPPDLYYLRKGKSLTVTWFADTSISSSLH